MHYILIVIFRPAVATMNKISFPCVCCSEVPLHTHPTMYMLVHVYMHCSYRYLRKMYTSISKPHSSKTASHMHSRSCFLVFFIMYCSTYKQSMFVESIHLYYLYAYTLQQQADYHIATNIRTHILCSSAKILL